MSEEQERMMRAAAAEFGKRGAQVRMTKTTPEERRRVARIAAKARWAKKAGGPGSPDGGPNGGPRPIRDGGTNIM